MLIVQDELFKSVNKTMDIECAHLPIVGANAILSIHNNATKPFKKGQNATYSCVKWSSLHSNDLYKYGFSQTAEPTDLERFQNISLTCQGYDIWSPNMTTLPRCVEFRECKKTKNGTDFYGVKYNVTASGKPCLSWKNQTIDSTPKLKSDDRYPVDGSVENAKNYCRNPLRKAAPFCIIDNITAKWEFCDIPECEDKRPFACSTTLRESEVFGPTSRETIAGDPCQYWNSSSPHPVYPAIEFIMPDEIGTAHNYCRNPYYTLVGLWCYTQNPNVRFDTCPSTHCPGYP
ncbi:unnamed protein product [Notodromas monacha]|uniref:Kringle domain-containing protein n=1 Tax=Notodromas monacha TaxID=399045 RepID=A0A7R9GEB4_9CRUS|nr:unnamed protein product [Notodromas monacha]CAG0919569.1 unnamed protein product [Notodromas monacha]